MNLAFDPWIPVISSDGELKLVSLLEAITNKNITDLATRPHERVALMRLFICVVHASLNGPKDYEDRESLQEKFPEAVRKYLEQHKCAFELSCWLQVANVEGDVSGTSDNDWSPVSKLGFFMASGNNTTLFDHEGMNNDERHIELTDTVLSMLTFQCFSPGGLSPQAYWDGVFTVKTTKDAPCAPRSMVHVLVREKDLPSSIWANTPAFDAIKIGIGRPVWEQMPTSFDDGDAIINATETYLGRLVPLSRVIRLHPNGQKMLLGGGLVYPSYPNFTIKETTAVGIVRTKDKKQERSVLSYDVTKFLWRELAAILAKRSSESGVEGPLSLGYLSNNDCDIIVCAMARDKATIVDTTESVYHIPAKLLSDNGRRIYQDEIAKAERLSDRLGFAVEHYRTVIDGGWNRLVRASANGYKLKSKLRNNALIRYWTGIENNLHLLIRHIQAINTDDTETTQKDWEKMMWGCAFDAYETSCSHGSARQLKAFVEGKGKLFYEPKEPKQEESKEVAHE